MHVQTCSQCGAKNQIDDDTQQNSRILCENCGEEIPTVASLLNEDSQTKHNLEGLPNNRFISQLTELFSNFQISYILIIANVGVFILMLASGVNAFEPDNLSIYRWGADFGPASMAPEPWRLITSMFLHIGIIHLAFNMYALFNIGFFAEEVFGKTRFLVLYLLSGIGGSLASICWNPDILSAGASGAIFGIFGGVLALLLIRKSSFPAAFAQQNLMSIIFFIGFNVLYGASNSFINNAAHLGGLATGFILAVALKPDLDNWRLRQLNPHVVFINQPQAGNWRKRFDLKQIIAIILMIATFSLATVTAKIRVNSSPQSLARLLYYSSDKIEIQAKTNIHFSNGATREEAQRLGAAFQQKKLFDANTGADIYLRKNKQSYDVYLIMSDETLDDDTKKFYQPLATELSSKIFGGHPVTINLCDDELDVKQAIKNN